jgi:D-arabinose 1-dehydrogenase-like Zn-dependent alcohol dehydrogenase
MDATLALAGLPDQPPAINVFNLVGRLAAIAGSMIGGMKETREMLDS